MTRPLYVGSEDIIQGTQYDNQAGTDVVMDLSTVTSVTLKAKIGKGATKTWTCTPDADQVTNTGVFTYQLLSTDLDVAGMLQMQPVIVSNGKSIKGDWVTREVKPSIS